MTSRTHSWPFVSIVAWPEGWDRERVATALAGARGLDLPTLRMRLGQEPPMVLEPVEPAAAAEMVETLVGNGGDAFTFTLETLAALGPTLGIRDLAVGDGVLAVDLREGLSTDLPFAAVQVLVRAQLSETVKVRREPPRFSTAAPLRHGRTWDSVKAEIESTYQKDLKTSDKLDIHTADGSVYEVDGNRFGFGVLGRLRGYSDKTNMDSLTELLKHLCPDTVVDTYFKIWRPPPGHRRLKLPGTAPGDTTFAFYSRWTALTYRHVMKG